MGCTECKGLCLRYLESNPTPRIRGPKEQFYLYGYRKCKICNIWWTPESAKSVLLHGVRCVCCKRVTSWKPRHPKRPEYAALKVWY